MPEYILHWQPCSRIFPSLRRCPYANHSVPLNCRVSSPSPSQLVEKAAVREYSSVALSLRHGPELTTPIFLESACRKVPGHWRISRRLFALKSRCFAL